MTRPRLFLLLGIVILLLLLGAGGAAWWYLYGPNPVTAAELVPGDTMAFATIPNAATLATGYQTSQLKKLVDDPNTKPLIDWITSTLGQKNLDLINTFLPNLSGQSFIALTHFNPDKPAEVGFIAGMKPKPGLGNFDAFVEKLKATWPDFLKEVKTGTGNVAGVDYQWIQGPGSPGKICVAQLNGWIVTAWGEASLQDWIERLQKKSATPSLAQNPDYQKSLTRIGKYPMTLAYLNYHTFLEVLQKQMAKANPAAGDYLFKKLGVLGGAAIGTRFENGEIVDRFSFLIPRQAQLDQGMGGATPCPFDTLKFTGPDTRLYWASSINFQQYWKNLQEQASMTPSPNPMFSSLLTSLQTWTKSAGLDLQHNIIDPLGSEFSLQVDWGADAAWPEVALFVKLDKPEDFKPTTTAIIEAVRKIFEQSAVIKELHADKGPTFAALKFLQTSPISPTITEDGPYLGLFLTENQAARAFQRDETTGLIHNADFIRQVGDKRNGASQILFFDSPQFLDRAYRTTTPYLSLVSMLNKQLAAILKDKTLPPDLTWLAPMGTWSCVMSADDDGIQGYSVSGVGNQGIFIIGSIGGAAGAAQAMGFIPKATGAAGTPPFPGNPPPPGPVPTAPVNNPVDTTNQTTTPPAPPDNSPNAPEQVTPAPTAPDATTNASPTPQPAPGPSDQVAPAPPVTPDAATNAAPASGPAPVTNSNSDAIPPTPEPAKTQ